MLQTARRATTREKVLIIIVLAAERAQAQGRQLEIETTRVWRAFYAASQRFPEAFPGLLFDTNGHQPESGELAAYLYEFVWLSGILERRNWLSSRLEMTPTMIVLLRKGHEQAVRDALPNLDRIVAFVCDSENPDNLLAKTIAAPPS